MLVGCGPSSPAQHRAAICVPAQADITPTSTQWVRVWTSQALTVRPGMFVGLEVVEPEGYASIEGFPWSRPTLSSPRVLVPARRCKAAAPAIPPLAVYYYQAIKTGSVTATVPLSREWLVRAHCASSTPCTPLTDLRVVVTVTRK